jgi:hypothetical protein
LIPSTTCAASSSAIGETYPAEPPPGQSGRSLLAG